MSYSVTQLSHLHSLYTHVRLLVHRYFTLGNSSLVYGVEAATASTQSLVHLPQPGVNPLHAVLGQELVLLNVLRHVIVRVGVVRVTPCSPRASWTCSARVCSFYGKEEEFLFLLLLFFLLLLRRAVPPRREQARASPCWSPSASPPS